MKMMLGTSSDFIQADQEFIFNISKAVNAVKAEYDDQTKGEPLKGLS